MSVYHTLRTVVLKKKKKENHQTSSFAYEIFENDRQIVRDQPCEKPVSVGRRLEVFVFYTTNMLAISNGQKMSSVRFVYPFKYIYRNSISIKIISFVYKVVWFKQNG